MQIRFVASKCDKKNRVHDYAYAVVQREGDGGSVDGGLRISAGIARRAFPAPRGGAADNPGHVARLENCTRTEAVTALRLMVGCSGETSCSLPFTREESGGAPI